MVKDTGGDQVLRIHLPVITTPYDVSEAYGRPPYQLPANGDG